MLQKHKLKGTRGNSFFKSLLLEHKEALKDQRSEDPANKQLLTTGQRMPMHLLSSLNADLDAKTYSTEVAVEAMMTYITGRLRPTEQILHKREGGVGALESSHTPKDSFIRGSNGKTRRTDVMIKTVEEMMENLTADATNHTRTYKRVMCCALDNSHTKMVSFTGRSNDFQDCAIHTMINLERQTETLEYIY
ncbi:hypothetical protein NDU88_002968 [Pleurodeles waltl]|uniref:Uncharacterized protein n=1 Tax=Pleurodeles waltl TaxID=8319 RepID=A0AAV7W143_PLEWA|nr:hypothetical protein NDU88_002968 [Pleurodeles waltl]